MKLRHYAEYVLDALEAFGTVVIVGGVLVFCIWIMLLGLAGLAEAGNVTHALKGGERVKIQCSTGSLQHSVSGGSVEWKCLASTQPPEPEPTPPPSSGKCKQPVSNSRPLKVGQEAPITLSVTPINRHFCSTQYPKGTDLSWGQYSASSFSALTVIVSERPNNTDMNSVDRANCFRGGQNDRMSVTYSSGCRIKRDTLYYVSITAKHPITGKPTGSGARQITLFNARK